MAEQKGIPQSVRDQVVEIIKQFNQENPMPMANSPMANFLRLLGVTPSPRREGEPRSGDYVGRFKGMFLYLDRAEHGGQLSEICRLKWTGQMNKWEFAIYRHSRNRYDPDEWLFPGSEEVNGTVVGAMRAGLKAYPR